MQLRYTCINDTHEELVLQRWGEKRPEVRILRVALLQAFSEHERFFMYDVGVVPPPSS